MGAAALLAVLASSCSSSGATSSSTADTQPSIPLASSSVDPGSGSSSGSSTGWATLAMGHLDDPLDTFWQLFSLTDGSDRWTLVTPPGVASNGGLAVSVDPRSVVAGFGPSQDLHFSPLAASTDSGRSWTAGLILGQLAPVPDSLTISTTGHPLALLQVAGGTVVTSAGGLSDLDAGGLEADPGHRCAQLLVRDRQADRGGVRCRLRPLDHRLRGRHCLCPGGRPGLFESAGDRWEPVGPVLPGVGSGPTEVIRIETIPDGAAVLVSAGRGSAAALYALWSTDGLRSWTVSSGLPLGRIPLASTGVTGAGGFVVTTAGPDGKSGVAVADQSAPRWLHLASPPAGTSAVVATPGGGFDALVPRQSVLDVYTLRSGRWDRSQVLDVPIQYGSSG